MKLSEIKQLAEGRVDPNVLMSIDNIVKAGKITSRTQYINLAKIIMMLRAGVFFKSANWFETQVPADLVSQVRDFPEDQLVQLAKEFQQKLFIKDQDFLNKCQAHQELNMLDWVRYVTAANS